MSRKPKLLLVLLLSCILSSCGKDYIFVGNRKVANLIPKTVMAVKLYKNAYDINSVSLDLYLGFSETSSDYEMTYCLYFENQYNKYEDIVTINDYTKLKNHDFITSYTDDEAVKLFNFSIDNKKVYYSNSINLKIDKSLFRYETGIITIKALGFVKTTDNNYKLNNLDANQIVKIKYTTNHKEVYLGSY